MPLETASVRVIALVFMFIARLRFLSFSSIVEVLSNIYGTNPVKNVRKLEKFIKNTVSCTLTWIFYNLVNTAMSFQSSFNLDWQMETYSSL